MPKPTGEGGQGHPAEGREKRCAALSEPRDTRAMPINERRRNDIATAVATYDIVKGTRFHYECELNTPHRPP